MDRNCETEDYLAKLKSSVQRKFGELRAALHMRETLLLRQLDAVASTQQHDMGFGATSKVYVAKSKLEDTSDEMVKFIVEQEDQLLSAIRMFGRFQLGNMQLALKQEDYITPANDHETMYKCLLHSSEMNATEQDFEVEHEPEAIVVDLSKDKSFIEHNAKHINDSIVNITLQEAKELIRKARSKRDTLIPPLNLEEMDDELESSIAEAVSSLGHEAFSAKDAEASKDKTKSSSKPRETTTKKAKVDRSKPEITINNCNGTINLRNISTLTINCGREETAKVKIPFDLQVQRHERDYNDNKNACPVVDEQTDNVQVEFESTQNSTASTSATTSNYSSSASSRSQSKKQKNNQKRTERETETDTETDTNTSTITNRINAANNDQTDYTDMAKHTSQTNDEDTREITCDFYNRLLNEIKKSLKQQQLHKTKRTGHDLRPETASSSMTSQNASSKSATDNGFLHDQRLVLQNFENLKVVLEANSDEDSGRPVQIEQWLAEIIMETDLEPMQNTDILEHSKINESLSNK